MSGVRLDPKPWRIVNRAGMHARPAAEFGSWPGRFTARIRVWPKRWPGVTGKSINGRPMARQRSRGVKTPHRGGRDATEARGRPWPTLIHRDSRRTEMLIRDGLSASAGIATRKPQHPPLEAPT